MCRIDLSHEAMNARIKNARERERERDRDLNIRGTWIGNSCDGTIPPTMSHRSFPSSSKATCKVLIPPSPRHSNTRKKVVVIDYYPPVQVPNFEKKNVSSFRAGRPTDLPHLGGHSIRWHSCLFLGKCRRNRARQL